MNRSEIKQRLTQIAKAFEWQEVLTSRDIHQLGQEQHQLESALDRLSTRHMPMPVYDFTDESREVAR